MKDNRNKFLDTIKGIAIILVVIGHCIQYGSGESFLKEEAFFDNFIFKFIYSFHMPLFMTISGYLFYFSLQKHTTKEIIINKIKTLIIPILSFSIIMTIIELLIGNDVKFIKIFFNNLWFLWAIFYCSIIVLIINKLLKDNLLVYLLVFIVLFFVPETHGIALYKFMYPFFVVGYLFNKYYKKEKNQIKINEKALIPILAIMFMFLLLNYNKEMYIYVTGYYILKDNIISQLLIDIYRMCIGFVGSTVIILLLKNSIKIRKCKYILDVLVYLGKKSLGIYAISTFIFTYILPRITYSIQNVNYFLILIETIIIIVISILITIIMQKNKISNMIFLGSRN